MNTTLCPRCTRRPNGIYNCPDCAALAKPTVSSKSKKSKRPRPPSSNSPPKHR